MILLICSIDCKSGDKPAAQRKIISDGLSLIDLVSFDLAFTCSKLQIETLEQGVKHDQS